MKKKDIFLHFSLRGFSLLEISISLLIIGIISSISVTQLRSVMKFNANQKTQSNIDFVLKTIGTYYSSNDHPLPYPSSSKQNIGYQNEDMKEEFGIIPFKTLGIMEKFAKDGNGQWLLYRMNPLFGKNINSIDQNDMGIKEFDSKITNDRVAIVIKVQDKDLKTESLHWYSEKSFIANFANNIQKQNTINIEKDKGISTENIQFQEVNQKTINHHNDIFQGTTRGVSRPPKTIQDLDFQPQKKSRSKE